MVSIRWGKKGKLHIESERDILDCLLAYDAKVVYFSQKQCKTVVRFDTLKTSEKAYEEMENGALLFKNCLKLHPNYCVIPHPKEKAEIPVESTNTEVIGIEALPESISFPLQVTPGVYPIQKCFENAWGEFDSCIVYDIDPEHPLFLFLEHNVWDSSFVIIGEKKKGLVVSLKKSGYQSVSFPLETHELRVFGEIRYTKPLRIACEEKAKVIILCNRMLKECDCLYPDFCHQRLLAHSESGKPTEIEKEHVYHVYDAIANHFSSTRYSHWEGVTSFLDSLPKGSLLLDVGCGNGKYLDYSRGRGYFIMGCDRSVELLHICRERKQEVQLIDGLFVPYREASFDGLISIAVIHHFSTNALRRRAIQNLLRILKPGGLCLVYVWAMEKDVSGKNTKSNRDYRDKDVMVKWKLQNQFYDAAKDECQHTQVDEKSGNRVFERYYHMFEEGELEWLLSTFPDVEILKSWYERENWCCVFKKT